MLVYECDEQTWDVEMRPKDTNFHDEGGAGPWPRSLFTRLANKVDQEHKEQLRNILINWEISYDDFEKGFTYAALDMANVMSGKEERMKEKVRKRRVAELQGGNGEEEEGRGE